MRVCQDFYHAAGPLLYSDLGITSKNMRDVFKGVTVGLRRSNKDKDRPRLNCKIDLLAQTRSIWVSNTCCVIDYLFHASRFKLLPEVKILHLAAGMTKSYSYNHSCDNFGTPKTQLFEKVVLHSHPTRSYQYDHIRLSTPVITAVYHKSDHQLSYEVDIRRREGIPAPTFRLIFLKCTRGDMLARVKSLLPKWKEALLTGPPRELTIYDLAKASVSSWSRGDGKFVKGCIREEFGRIIGERHTLAFKTRADYLSEGHTDELSQNDLAALRRSQQVEDAKNKAGRPGRMQRKQR